MEHHKTSLIMVLEGEAKKLKIILGQDGRVYQRPLYEAILFAAKKYQLAGVTITKGILSYGGDSILHNAKVFDISEDLPIIIEMVDKEERIYDFADIVSKLMDKANVGGIIFTESVDVIAYKKTKE